MFQSTPPSREATRPTPRADRLTRVSIHAPLTGGDCIQQCQNTAYMFQSTPPSREATWNASKSAFIYPFQSTPPSREATTSERDFDLIVVVSIHAPLTGGDKLGLSRAKALVCFNPRPPHGRRLGWRYGGIRVSGFQSTPPSREATRCGIPCLQPSSVSIHAPLTGGDPRQLRYSR